MTRLVASSIRATERIAGGHIISFIVLMISLAICSTHDHSPVECNMQLNISYSMVVRFITWSSAFMARRRSRRIKSQLRARSGLFSVSVFKLLKVKLSARLFDGVSDEGRLNAKEEEMQLFCFAGLTRLVASSIIATERIAGGHIISFYSAYDFPRYLFNAHLSILSCMLHWRARKIDSIRERLYCEETFTAKS